METEIALIAYGYLFAWIGVAIVVGQLVKRVLQREPKWVRIPIQSRYARERYKVKRFNRW